MIVPQPFQYQGSKRALAAVILQQFPTEVQRVVEPFCGSAALAIAAAARGPAREFWLNDCNQPLAELLGLMINSPQELAKAYAELWRAEAGDAREHYDQVLESFNRSQNPRLLLQRSAVKPPLWRVGS